MLRPRFVKMFEFGYFDEPRDDFTFDELDTEAHRQAAREIAEQGMVLMRNDGGVLPLTGDEDTVALIGPDHFTDQPKRAPSFGLDNFIVGPPRSTPRTASTTRRRPRRRHRGRARRRQRIDERSTRPPTPTRWCWRSRHPLRPDRQDLVGLPDVDGVDQRR